jgi:hypothetical protein
MGNRADCLQERKSGDNMADLMRAKDILDAIKRNKERLAPEEAKGAMFYGYRRASDHIAELITRTIPTVDAVEVVRCKDCKYCEYPAQNVTRYRCSLFDRCVIADWFCASAEGRE